MRSEGSCSELPSPRLACPWIEAWESSGGVSSRNVPQQILTEFSSPTPLEVLEEGVTCGCRPSCKLESTATLFRQNKRCNSLGKSLVAICPTENGLMCNTGILTKEYSSRICCFVPCTHFLSLKCKDNFRLNCLQTLHLFSFFVFFNLHDLNTPGNQSIYYFIFR